MFCGTVGVPPLTFSAGLLTTFAAWLDRGDPAHNRMPAAPTTIERRLSGVVITLRDNNVPAVR